MAVAVTLILIIIRRIESILVKVFCCILIKIQITVIYLHIDFSIIDQLPNWIWM